MKEMLNKPATQNPEYCNFEDARCKEQGKVYRDDDGFICARCGGRVSKWLPVAIVLENETSRQE